MTTEIDGTPGNDTIVLPEGGAVIHAGGYHDDIFCDTSYGVPDQWVFFDPPKVGAHLSASDSIDGGDDIDTVYLNGNYNLTFTATTMTNVENLYLDSNNWLSTEQAFHSYRLVLNDATIAKGSYLIINGMGARNLVVDDRAETDGSLAVYSSDGHNKIIGGSGDDFLGLWHGTGIAHGRGGDDVLRVGGWNGRYMPLEEGALSGGKGHDTLDLMQVQLKMLHFDAASTGIEVLTNAGEITPPVILGDERDNVFDLSGFEVPPDNTNPITVDGLEGNDVLTGWSQVNHLDGGEGNDRLTGGHSSDILTGGRGADTLSGGMGKDTLEGDHGADTLSGGGGGDTLTGGGGADWLQGGGGADRFVFESATDSTSVTFDTIDGFDFSSDRFDVAVSVSDAGVLNGGHLDAGNFDPLLTDGLAGHLSAHGAVLYTPDSGSFASETFLIVDQNGVAGYQSGGDLVMHLTHAINAEQIAATDFV